MDQGRAARLQTGQERVERNEESNVEGKKRKEASRKAA
jgi:hypothetical protein